MTAQVAAILVVMAAALGTALLTLAGAALLAARRHRRTAAANALALANTPIAFLFDDEHLIDATPAARGLLATSQLRGTDWARLAQLLRHRFPGLDAAIRDLATLGKVELPARGEGGDSLRAEWQNGMARIIIADENGDSGDLTRAERQSLAAMEAELDTLRTILRAGPVAVWKQAPDGTVLWANEVYFALAEDVLGAEAAQSFPPPRLFPVAPGGLAENGAMAAPIRAALRPEGGRPRRWFECHGYGLGTEVLCFAAPADSLVRAEEALREFVQTLSKTFAHLPIGLAIFDRHRRLALFNPALTDLTALEIEFLSARPTLFAFLDRLREGRRIPEPRDYRSWRQRITELEAAASGGFVQEDWTLPSGQTFRVTGRPHPDGAVAFLFEDISAEVSLTRRFRSEIELGQTVIDSLDEAIAVFSPPGTLTFSNAAYTTLWGFDPSATLAEVGIVDATRHWQSLSQPTPIWGDAREFLSQHGERVDWSGSVRLIDGRVLNCRFRPLAGGATLVGFLETATDVPEATSERTKPRRSHVIA